MLDIIYYLLDFGNNSAYKYSMTQIIGEQISVTLKDNAPLTMIWRNRDYKITKVGLRHHFYEGKILIHVFSVLSETLFLKLKFNTKYLKWNLMETDLL